MLIRAPIVKDIIELLELFLVENPVCNPITETNRDVPSFEDIFSVLCAFAMISRFPSGISIFIRKPTNMEANKIPAIPSEIPFIRILPRVNPITIIKNRRLSGEGVSLSKTLLITKQLHMQGTDIVVHHLDFIDPLIYVIVPAEPYFVIKFLFKLSEPNFGRTVDVRLEKLL